MDFRSVIVVAGAIALIMWIAGIVASRLSKRRVTRNPNPMPRINLSSIPKAEQERRAAFVLAQIQDLKRLPWGQQAQQAVIDRRRAEESYHKALEAIWEAEGDYQKMAPVLDDLLKLPLDLGLTGVARIVMALSYFHGYLYSPPGVQAALAFTTTALKDNPQSVDAWIARLWFLSIVPDRTLQPLAQAALKQVQTLNPNHPYFPDAESFYYRRYGSKEQYETAIRRMIELAPSRVVKQGGYDRLASFYAEQGRVDDALATYRQMLFEFPDGSAWLWHNYSLQLMKAKRYQEALEASDRALTFFEFGVARDVNNQARKELGMAPAEPPIR
jgi:tetratricopeptide (TPR) repeat protein